jgi:NADPH:quinone reductase-like Zn-dependent oxidoreductase
MKAAIVGETGAEVRDLPKPAPKPNEILIRVQASSLNRADLLIGSGQHHGAASGVGARLGLECAGVVEAIGGEAEGFKQGDGVMASTSGGHAAYAVADWGRVHPIPADMTYAQAACLPVALHTMHNAIVSAGRLSRGETLLIQGASSAVGLMGLQIGKLMGAALVMGTSTNIERRARLKEFGCDLALDSGDPTWPEQAKRATGGKGVDLIIDLVSAGVANQNLPTRTSRRPRSAAASSMSAGSAACAASSISTSTRSSASNISASRSAPARSRRCARSIAQCVPTCGQRSNPASCPCRSTAPSRCPRSPRRWRQWPPTDTSERS